MTIQRGTSSSGVSVPLGSGKDSALGVTQPGANTGPYPGVPGEIRYAKDPVRVNVGRPVTTLQVTNTADRPVTVGSHYHFAEVNEALQFDRAAAWGKRLNIISGGMVRFDPGMIREIDLVAFVGNRIAAGFRGKCGGRLDG